MVGQNIRSHTAASEYEWFCPSSKELDLLDRKAVGDFIRKCKPDLVIHAAGRVGGIQANMKNPVAFLLENMYMGMNVISESCNNEVTKLINLGSSCMYPRNANNPLSEPQILTGELEPTNEGYALAKIACSRLCAYVSSEHPGYAYKTIVPCNLYGRFDKFDPAHSHMIPAVIRKICEAKVNGNENVSIWGDGTARREFMYAEDLADFIFFALDKLTSLPQDINVGLGVDYSVTQYYLSLIHI